mmetsp:Transcript_31850/g.57003  ORF Transcript_31850/g.57003 Transcript_31850/m.57003 type:complete len:504 (-) Transcript_31850:292-1803(-)
MDAVIEMTHHLPPLLVKDELVENKLDVEQGVDVLALHSSLDDARFLVTQHMSRLYASVDEVGPRRYTECHAFHVGTALEAIQRGWHALDAELVACIHRHAEQRVGNDLVAEAVDQYLLVFVQIDILDTFNYFQGWAELLFHNRGVVSFHQRVLSSLVNVLQSHQQSWENHGGVDHIEEPDLRQLVWMHVFHDLHSSVFPARAPRNAVHEFILNNPLSECFAIHRPVILQPVIFGELTNQLSRSNGGDPVNHTVRESAVEFHPFLEVLAVLLSALYYLFPRIVTVARNIVTRQNGGSTGHGCSPSRQPRDNVSQSRGSQELVRIGICLSPGVLGCPERKLKQSMVALAGWYSISEFCDGETEDLCAVSSKALHHLARALRSQQHIADRTCDSDALLADAFHLRLCYNSVQIILGSQSVSHTSIVREYAYTSIRPLIVFFRVQAQQCVDVPQLVRSVEPTHAEVHDTGCQLAAIVVRKVHVSENILRFGLRNGYSKGASLIGCQE